MEKQFVPTSAAPHVTLKVNGDLRLKGQDDFQVVAKADDPENLTIESREDQVVIHSLGDCYVRVPQASVVQIEAVHGSAVCKALDGDLTIGSIDGDLELRNTGKVFITRVNGSLAAKNIEGDFKVDTINGELSARNVQGDFTVTDAVRGDLNLSNVGGSASAFADGNITLRLDPAPGHTYDFSCHGNLFCRLSSDASAEINVPKASQVMVELPGIHASAPVQTPYAITLGEGDARITLSADGNVILDTHAPSFEMEDFNLDINTEVNGIAESVSQQISQQVDSHMRMMEEQLKAQLSSLSMRLNAARLTEDQARRIEERAREASERATARAQERVRRAQERLEQKLAAAQRKLEQRHQAFERTSRHTRHGWNINLPTPPAPPGEPVSEDERLMILHMLEEKKISLEEADALLSALEGKSE